MAIELQNLYAALTQATDGLTVSWPVTDVGGAELRPAFVVERLLGLFPGLRVEREDPGKEYRLTAVQPALETAGQARRDRCGGILPPGRNLRPVFRPWSAPPP